MKQIVTMTVSDARDQLGELVDKVAFSKEPAVITKHRKERVAIIPYDLLELLTKIEAIIDLKKAEIAFKEYEEEGGKSLEDIKKELGL